MPCLSGAANAMAAIRRHPRVQRLEPRLQDRRRRCPGDQWQFEQLEREFLRPLDVHDRALARNDIHHLLEQPARKELLLHTGHEIIAEHGRGKAISIGGKHKHPIALDQDRRHRGAAIVGQPLLDLANQVVAPDVDGAWAVLPPRCQQHATVRREPRRLLVILGGAADRPRLGALRSIISARMSPESRERRPRRSETAWN